MRRFRPVSYTHLIHELGDVDRLLNAGADKISINSSAIRRPGLIDEIAKNFGSQDVYKRQVHESGIKIIIATGRAFTDLHELEEIPYDPLNRKHKPTG